MINEYFTRGYCVVDNFLAHDDAEELYRLFSSEQQWQQLDQVRETHYQHVFKMDNDALPNEAEIYIAKFGRSPWLESKTKAMQEKIIQKINFMLGVKIFSSDNRCYRLLPRDLYRTHIDDYTSDIGIVYYVNKRWVWDWGGLLHICTDNEKTDAILPKFNRAVLLNNKKFRYPHFVSGVEVFALEPRYSIVSFCKL